MSRKKKEPEQEPQQVTISNKDPAQERFIETLRDSGYRVIDRDGVIFAVCRPDEIDAVSAELRKISNKIGYYRSYGVTSVMTGAKKPSEDN